MLPIRYTRNLFLRGLCVVYLFSFISFYIQIPGLYGDNGILPARSVLENNKYKTWSAKVHYQPTLLWLAPFLGLDTQYALDVLAILGSFLAFTGFVSQKFCTIPLFAGLWSLYFSLYQVGQIFIESVWDNLLLEVGFLSLLVAPLLPGRRSNSKRFPTAPISFWLVRWVLFRYLLSTGIQKLSTSDPKWWGLSALDNFFETTLLPSPLSWYAHHLPATVLKLTTVATIISESFLPFLFFAPFRSVRISGYSIQLIFQIFIVLTGNYNFLPLLVVTMLLSLLDDKLFFGRSRFISGVWSTIFDQFMNFLVHGAVIYGAVVLFNLKITDDSQIAAKIGFSKDQFNDALKYGILLAMYVGVGSLTLTITRAIATALTDSPGVLSKLLYFLGTVFYSVIALGIFVTSTVPLSTLHPATNSSISPTLRTMYNRLGKLHVVNDYRYPFQFHDVRSEIVLEGANNIEGPWQEYNFLYKPGNVNHSLPFVAPHSPRVDWQMGLAAYSTYKEQPWLLSFVHRILQGKSEVIALIDRNHSPFQDKPPKYIRGILYNYKFTKWSQRSQAVWWQREKVGEYFPAFTKDSPALVDYLKARNLLPTVSKENINIIWKEILDKIRFATSRLEATLLVWSVFTAGCAIIITTTRSK